MANQNPNVVATDDPELAKSLGLDYYDESTGQWTKTPETVEEVEQYAADEREQDDEQVGEVTAHAAGTVTPGEGESGDDDDEVDDDEDHPAV